jgi:MYXO-CTERM domain-containing protein
MSASFDRFLNARQRFSRKASLGRAFSVLRQSWKLTDDPQVKPPKVEVIAARRTASDAADLAREAAWSYKRYGFHKPSGAWWGADADTFHRFVVQPGSQAVQSGALAALALAGLAVFALTRRRRAAPQES